MIKKNILVLGGSYLQSKFISDAIEQKFEVHVVDADKNCYCSNFNIYFHNFSFTDLNKILKLVDLVNPLTIISPSNEKGNLVSAKISKIKNFSYNNINLVNRTLDKFLMRKHLSFHKDLRQAKLYSLDENLIYPVIVKPSISSASRGVSIARSNAELDDSINLASKYTETKSQILIEEYIEGKQYSLETITKNGEHYLVGITEEYLSGPPFFIERYHLTGPEIWEKNFMKFNSYINILLNHFDFQVGPAHIEVMVIDNVIYLIEIASRSGGWRDKLLNYSKGSDLNTLILQSYTMNKINVELIKKPKLNSMVGIKTKFGDEKIEEQAKEHGVLVEVYNNGKNYNHKATNLIDAVGYFYLASHKPLNSYELS